MIAAPHELGEIARRRDIRLVEVKRDHYELTFWPRPQSGTELFNDPHPDLTADALAELSTPPRFTYDTHPLECERLAGVRARPSNPNRKPTPKMLEYLRRFKHPEADKLNFDQAQEFLDERFGRKAKQGEMKIVVAESVTPL